MRRTPPTKAKTTNRASARHEKPQRYSDTPPSIPASTTAMAQVQRVRWIKTTGLILFVVLFFYWLSPQGAEIANDKVVTPVKQPDTPAPVTPPTAPNPDVEAPKPETKKPTVDTSLTPPAKPQGQTPSDSTYGTDKCTVSSSKDKPIVQYVLMVDAGSTGSRIHVYKFNNCGDTPELEGEVFEKSKPGLSAFADDPVAAAKSLDPLMKIAMENVPDALKSCTPIAVKATAGLRLTGAKAAQDVLDAVRSHLETSYPFPVVSKEDNGVVIMDGSDEGVYAWITTNYLLGKIGGLEKTPTAAVFDLGGGSTQIVFEPTFPETNGKPEKMSEGDHKYELKFGGNNFTLYQHSHLGYGLMSARKALHASFVEDLYESHKSDSKFVDTPLVHPCLPPGTVEKISVTLSENHPLGEVANFTMTGPATALPAQCRALAEKILHKEKACALMPCSFNGVHQPSLARTFATQDVFIFSYFYERTKPLGMPESFTLSEMHDLTASVCGGEDSWAKFKSIPGALEELKNEPMFCTDLNFMMALLHTGYEMPLEREVRIAQKIKGNEVGWCLGASLPLLSGEGWTCKVKEISA
ncbi:putative guanosine-diphosphatase [Ceratocystis platani]|uniref:guanosine-diphosphatase n=1 Tax=Ceratocystis fimbriata f. sp. platani TaxID=88771 RepID=A0A0F8CTY7_CERFI|nr:putative guanosine-diphosphatase [Ceratocystis platani]